jgi:hypothetical protein
MSNFSNKNPMPFWIQTLLTTAGVICLMLVFNMPPVTGYERQLLKGFILILLFIVFVYFFLKQPLEKIKQKFIQVIDKNLLDSPEPEPLVPEDFTQETAQGKGFSFYYPKTWFLGAANDPALYKEAREQLVEPGIFGARNFNISCHDIRTTPDLDKIFQAIIQGVLQALSGGRLEFKQKFKTSKFIGMRYKVVYRNMQGLDLACYQVALTNHSKHSMLIFTFTCQVNDFAQSKVLFDQIAGLAKIFN